MQHDHPEDDLSYRLALIGVAELRVSWVEPVEELPEEIHICI